MTKETFEKAHDLIAKISDLENLLNKINDKSLIKLTEDEVFEQNLTQLALCFTNDNDDGKSFIIEYYQFTPKLKSLVKDFYQKLLKLINTEINASKLELEKL